MNDKIINDLSLQISIFCRFLIFPSANNKRADKSQHVHTIKLILKKSLFTFFSKTHSEIVSGRGPVDAQATERVIPEVHPGPVIAAKDYVLSGTAQPAGLDLLTDCIGARRQTTELVFTACICSRADRIAAVGQDDYPAGEACGGASIGCVAANAAMSFCYRNRYRA